MSGHIGNEVDRKGRGGHFVRSSFEELDGDQLPIVLVSG